ncbi:MAG TPA: thioredoxin [Dongiaceae bacterium]|jgi:putative thioredoxin|nr:thioredoxin [Dongiaceae bacterium]
MDTMISAGNGAAPAANGAGALIKNSDTKGFMADVIEASRTVPVIVDFWAPWCGPCKQLGPALEKAVNEAKGAVRMVKIDIDKNQQLAAQMRIQSIPAVYAFYQGQPVDGFVGALPDSQVKTFVTKLAGLAGGAEAGPSPVEEALEQAEEALTAGDHGTAKAIFDQVLAHETGNLKAIAGLTLAEIAAKDVKAARTAFERAPADKRADAALAKAKAALELAEQGAGAAGKLGEYEAALAADANNHQARFDRAMALYASGQQEQAIDDLLEIVSRKRDWNEEGARKQLVKFFEAMGPTHALTLSGRRRLSSLLFR